MTIICRNTTDTEENKPLPLPPFPMNRRMCEYPRKNHWSWLPDAVPVPRRFRYSRTSFPITGCRCRVGEYSGPDLVLSSYYLRKEIINLDFLPGRAPAALLLTREGFLRSLSIVSAIHLLYNFGSLRKPCVKKKVENLPSEAVSTLFRLFRHR
ncbi:hypothetical protein J6590_099620 [Homalodisca vitripennis]|nr:hypothetical protein J6590_099620 [Homalodisca vitripennis]